MFILFLDDERNPDLTVKVKEWRDSLNRPALPDAIKNHMNNEFTICRTCEDAEKEVKIRGFPYFVFFDHDLGTEKTGLDFMKFLVNYDIDNNEMPSYQWWYVHSANPIGKNNIESYIKSYIKQK